MGRKPFTLIEIVVCMAILAIVGSVFIYKGAGLLKERRFTTSLKNITSEILLTKSIAINYQIDIHLTLEQKKGKVCLLRKVDCANSSIRGLFQSEIVFPEIIFGEDDDKKEIYFYGNGWIEGDDKLNLFMASHCKKQYSVEIKHSFRKAL